MFYCVIAKGLFALCLSCCFKVIWELACKSLFLQFKLKFMVLSFFPQVKETIKDYYYTWTDMHTWKSEVQMQKPAALFGMVSHQTDFTELTFSMFSSKTDICPKRVSSDGGGSNPASIQMRCGSEDLKLHAHHTSKLHCFTMSPGDGMWAYFIVFYRYFLKNGIGIAVLICMD